MGSQDIQAVNSIDEIKDEVNNVSDRKKAKESSMQIIRFLIEDKVFAIDIMDMKFIQELYKIRRLPNSKPYVAGLLNLRGDIIPVIDLKKRLELENISLNELSEFAKSASEITSEEEIKENGNSYESVVGSDVSNDNDDDDSFNSVNNEEDEQQILICHVKDSTFGVLVDRITKVQYLTNEQYQEVPKLITYVGEQFIKGFAKIDNSVVVILNLATLINEEY